MRLFVVAAVAIFLLVPDCKAASENYFYTIAQTETDDPAWSYAVPTCQELSAAAVAKMKSQKKCKKQKDGSKRCWPGTDVLLENVSTKKKQKFPLADLVFRSLETCQKHRKTYLQPAD